MREIRLSRSGFPGIGNFSWMNYFVKVLSNKYKVIIDSKNPDLVFCSNLHYNEGEFDYFTNDTIYSLEHYGKNIKSVFLTGEASSHAFHQKLQEGNNSYVLGYTHIDHPRYLRFPTYILDVFVLHNEGGMFDHPFNWLTEKKNYENIIKDKKHFCSVVQKSVEHNREIMFDLIAKDFFIKSSGPWRATSPEFDLNKNKYHNGQYIGKIDGLTYKDKIEFFKDTIFNIAFQYTNEDYITQEKIVHAFAGNCIPIYKGNKFIEEEGFNPESFINTHRYNTLEEAYSVIREMYSDKNKLKNMIEAPIFVDNKLPIYFNEEYLLAFFDKILD